LLVESTCFRGFRAHFAAKASCFMPDRDIAALRMEIIREVVQHPLTIAPMGGAALATAWALAFAPTPLTVVFAIGGVAAGTLGGFYNLLIRGEVIRDRITARWEREEKLAEEQRRTQVRQDLLNARGSADLVQLYDDFETMRESLMDALRRSQLTDVRRAEFELAVEANHAEAMNILGRVVFIQRKLTKLLDLEPGRAQQSEAVRALREERQELAAHVRKLMSALERMTEQVPALGEDAVEESERTLDRLRESIDAARRAQAQIDEQVAQASGRSAMPE